MPYDYRTRNATLAIELRSITGEPGSYVFARDISTANDRNGGFYILKSGSFTDNNTTIIVVTGQNLAWVRADVYHQVVTSQDVIITDSSKGTVIKDSNGHYWRFTAGTSGEMNSVDLGTDLSAITTEEDVVIIDDLGQKIAISALPSASDLPITGAKLIAVIGGVTKQFDSSLLPIIKTTLDTFDGANITLDSPERCSEPFEWSTPGNTITVASTNKIGASYTLALIATGVAGPDIEGSTLADDSIFDPTPNYLTRIVFYFDGIRTEHKYKDSFSLVDTFPSIITQPTAQTASDGNTATFTVVASGGSLTYQWKISTDNITFTNISGATSSTYNRTAILADTGKHFRCDVTNGLGTVSSNSVVLTVTAASTLDFYFALSPNGDQVYAIANKALAASPSFAGITLSDKTVTGIVRDTHNTNNIQYTLSFSGGAYAFNATPTITVPSGLWVATDADTYAGTITGPVDLYYGNVTSDTIRVALGHNAANSGGFVAHGISKIPIEGDVEIIQNIGTAVGRGALIGFSATPTNGPINTTKFYALQNEPTTNNIVSGRDGSNVNLTNNSPAVEDLIKIKRIAGVVSTEVHHLGSWTPVYAHPGTYTGTLYAYFAILDPGAQYDGVGNTINLL